MSDRSFMTEPLGEWMKEDGPESDIVISTRVRLARNVHGSPFPMLSTNHQAQEVFERVKLASQSESLQSLGPFEWIVMESLNDHEKKALVEKHLISPNFAADSRHGALMLSKNEAISIMVNEEDHLRIQSMKPGFQIKQTWEQANRLDDELEAGIDFAFDEKWGYLTSCPTNVGSGMRASVMLHLPALVMNQQINHMVHAVTQVGLVVRGLYGEGSEAAGNLFQISNQITLGQSEEEVIDHLYQVVKQLVDHERQARERMKEQNNPRTIDRIFRSMGMLSHAYIMDSKEALQRLSDVRLGVEMGYIKGVSRATLKELTVLTQPGFLQVEKGISMSPEARDIRRAQMIRDHLAGKTGDDLTAQQD